MLILIRKNTPKNKINKLISHLKQLNLAIKLISDDDFDLLKISGNCELIDEKEFKQYDFVISVQRISSPFKFISRKNHPEDSVYEIKNTFIGKDNFSIMAGPCSIESAEQLEQIAIFLQKNKIKFLRGGTYKLRTSPYSFQGLGLEGLKILHKVANKYNLISISEITDASQIADFEKYVDIIQVGTRNMQNYELLKKLGKVNKPILLKRGFANTIEEFLYSAEYLMANGNQQVILCERGIRTFEKYTRATLDFACIPIIKKISHLPIIVDPSHSSGVFELVSPMSLASLACGADGLILEINNQPEKALSDGAQALKFKTFKKLLVDLNKMAKVVHKKI